MGGGGEGTTGKQAMNREGASMVVLQPGRHEVIKTKNMLMIQSSENSEFVWNEAE